jgi:putative transposase
MADRLGRSRRMKPCACRAADGRAFRLLNVLERRPAGLCAANAKKDFNREGLGIEVISRCRLSGSSAAMPYSSNGVADQAPFASLLIDFHAINCQAMDNGPEYFSGKLPLGNASHRLPGKLLESASGRGISIRHIQPGKPQQNAYIER